MKNALRAFVLLLYCVNGTVAQDLNIDLKQLLTQYEDKPFQCEITTKMYQTHSSIQPDFTEQSLLKRMGSQFFYESKKQVLLSNQQFSINYNKERAVVYCSPKIKPTNQQFSLFDFSQILDQFDSVEYKGLVGKDKCYILKHTGGPFSVMEFYFDPDQLQLKKIVYHYNEHWTKEVAKMEVFIKHLPMNRPFKSDQFSERQFVEISAGKVRLQTGLKKHQLILGDGLDYASAR